MKENPLITVYIISKDRKDLLIRAIKSCFNQTYSNIEVIVVDDCSQSFNPRDLELIFKDKALRIEVMPKAVGANPCRNLALSKANGKYITGLDDDDYFTTDRIAVLFNALEREKGISAVSSRHLFETVQSKVGVKNKAKYFIKFLTSLCGKGLRINLENLLNKNIVGNQVLVSVDKLRGCGGFDDKLPALQDYETWLRLIKAYGPIYRVNRFLYIKNDQAKSITGVNRKKLLGFDYIFQKHKDFFNAKEHCFELHKLLYEQKYISLSQWIHLFKSGNRKFLVYLLITYKVRLR